MLREVDIGWSWQVYIEMFLAGIAAGAYITAAMLEFVGRGRSPIARTAHWIAMPLILLATMLLISKLERPERFWHMVIQSENIPIPMGKWWSPISSGSWGLMVLAFFATVSFVDAVISRDWLSFGPWRSGRTLHGSKLGVIWMIGGILVAFFVAGYSGALISVTAVPGWVDTVFIAPFFIAISMATGTAALLLIESFRRRAPEEEVGSLARANMLMVAWQMVLLIILAISLGGAITFFLSSGPTIAAFIIGILLGLAALALLWFGPLTSAPVRYSLVGLMVLVSGLLFRYAVVMGPQHAIV